MSKYFISISLMIVCLAFSSCRNHTAILGYYDTERKLIHDKRVGYFKEDSNGNVEFVLDGKYETWYPTGQKQSEVYFSNNHMVGKWIVRWPHGIIRSKHKFDRNGLIHGEQFVYDSNGKLLKSYWMNHGTGTEYIYHDNNILRVQAEWKNGKLDGIRKIFSPTGELIRIEKYSDGIKQE